MRHYNADFSATFQTFTPEQREYFRWMLMYGFTDEVAVALLEDGLHEEGNSGSRAVDGFEVRFTESAWSDYELFRGDLIRQQIRTILADLMTAKPKRRHRQLGASVWLVAEEMFRVVFKNDGRDVPVIYAIAVDGINPLQKVWRYFDQSKAEDLLRTGCLYFCRLDKLTGDPREGRLPILSRETRTRAFQETFGGNAEAVVDDGEEFVRGTTYVTCWTRRDCESYLAWRHYCASGGGFAIQTTWRRIAHVHDALRAKDSNVFCKAVEYLDRSKSRPSSDN
jgi:hypothetical protein